MFYGRLPAKDTTQMKSIVNKIVEYETFSFPDTVRHYEKAIAVAGKDAGHVTEMNGQLNYASLYLNNENNITPEIFYYSGNDSIRNAGYDSVKTLINDGVGFINYTGHGTSTSWLYTGIDYTLVSSLTNKSRYPVIISNACQTARFNVDNCFGSSFVRAQDKGAIGFIGCTMDSYWAEDYYWAVGVSPVVTDPVFEDSGPGFYDGLFHTHNENPSEWYTSLGKILFAGNMSVSLSTSSLKKYYWEAYTLLGDPSLSPYIGKTDSFAVNIPDSLPVTLSNISLTTDPFSLVAISHFDTLWDASYASPSGAVNLEIPALPSKDSCLMVITGQNHRPLIKTVYFTQPDTAWINISDINTNDTGGNNDGFADYSEEISLKIDLQNAGLAAATGVYAKVSSSSPYISIVNDSAWIGNVDGLTSITIPSAFTVDVGDSIPNMAIVNYTIDVFNNGHKASFSFDNSIHAPEPEIMSCYVDDMAGGNGNGLAEPGESFDVVFRIRNTGSSSTSGHISITDGSPYIIFDPATSADELLPEGTNTEIHMPASLAAETPDAGMINFNVVLDCPPYSDTLMLGITSGRSTEDFESNNFSLFPWINSSTYPWILTYGEAYSNVYSARSADISDNQESVLSMYLNIPKEDTIRFWYRVSSETGYDFFSFSADSSIIFRESGESGWKLWKWNLKEGVHYLEWKYSKDGSLSAGEDAAWIDYVRFPGISFLENDLAVNKITSPATPSKSNRQEVITTSVSNLGQQLLNGFTLAYSVNSAIPVIETFDNLLEPGDTIEVSFSQTADLSAEGEYDLMVYSMQNDNYLNNDTTRIMVQITGISDLNVNNGAFTPAPNPFSDQLRLLSQGTYEDIRIELYTITGIKVYQSDIPFIQAGEEIIIPGEKLANGIYVLQISGKGIRAWYRVVRK